MWHRLFLGRKQLRLPPSDTYVTVPSDKRQQRHNLYNIFTVVDAPAITQRFWMHDAQAMKVIRRVTRQEQEEAATRRPNGADKFDEFMAAMKTKYPKLFAGDRLSPVC